MNSKVDSMESNNIEVTQIFAEFIAGVQTDILSDGIVKHIKEYIIDYLGISLAAAGTSPSTEPILKGIEALGAKSGSSTVFLKGRHYAPQYAGLLNASLSHSLDFNDTYAARALHPSVTAISASLTAAKLVGTNETDIKRFLLTVAVGYEVICRLGRELGPDSYLRGFHNTGTAGVYGAIASIAVLKRLSETVIKDAFGLALSKTAGSMQFLENGAWNKRLHPGFAVHDAFLCISLAEAGVIGAAKAIEGKDGLLHSYSPKPDPDLAFLSGDLGIRWEFLQTAMKPYPSCRITHGLIEMADRHGKLAKGREIEKVTIWLNPHSHGIVGARIPKKLHPADAVNAQFSSYYQFAYAWIHGSASGFYCYDKLGDKDISALSEKITCEKDPAVGVIGSKLDIHYKDGEKQKLDITEPLGELSRPIPRHMIEEKYLSLTTPVIGEEKAKALLRLVDELERHSVTELMGLLV